MEPCYRLVKCILQTRTHRVYTEHSGHVKTTPAITQEHESV